MLKFDSIDELRDNKKLQSMCRYEHKNVILNGKEVIACTTDQQYEDIIWGHMYDMFDELSKKYNVDFDKEYASSYLRDYVLEYLEDNCGLRFVDVYDEY